MTKEQYESLPLSELKAIAKARGLKGISGMKKSELIEVMLGKDETDSAQKGTERRERRTTQENHSEKPAEKATERHAEKPVERQVPPETSQLDSGQVANGILEVLADGYGFIRSANYLPGENDIYINPAMIRRYNLKTGDILCGNIKVRSQTEKFAALLYLKSINGYRPEEASKRRSFEDLTPIFPNSRIHLEEYGCYEQTDLFEMLYRGMQAKIRLMYRYPYIGSYAMKVFYERDPEVCTEIQERYKKYRDMKAASTLLNLDPKQFREGIDLSMMYQEMYLASLGYLWEFMQNEELDVEKMEADFTKLFEFWKKAYLRE